MLNWDIIPFKGVGKFKLYSSVEDVKKILDDEKFSYSEEIQRHETWTIPEPWILISVKDTINFWTNKFLTFPNCIILFLFQYFTVSISGNLQ